MYRKLGEVFMVLYISENRVGVFILTRSSASEVTQIYGH